MKLFTRTDLERAARLAARALANGAVDSDVEGVVAKAVEDVASNVPPVYDKAMVLRVARMAVEFYDANFPKYEYDDAAEAAFGEVVGER